jgi:hypothetical protein
MEEGRDVGLKEGNKSACLPLENSNCHAAGTVLYTIAVARYLTELEASCSTYHDYSEDMWMIKLMKITR